MLVLQNQSHSTHKHMISSQKDCIFWVHPQYVLVICMSLIPYMLQECWFGHISLPHETCQESPLTVLSLTQYIHNQDWIINMSLAQYEHQQWYVSSDFPKVQKYDFCVNKHLSPEYTHNEWYVIGMTSQNICKYCAGSLFGLLAYRHEPNTVSPCTKELCKQQVFSFTFFDNDLALGCTH